MDERFNTIAQQIFQRPLDQCSPEEIRSFTDLYPYYAPGQFLLLQKLEPGTEAYNKQYQKAILYYHNPLQFASLLEPPRYEDDFFATEAAPLVSEPEQPEPIEVPEPEPGVPVTEKEEPVAEATPFPEPEPEPIADDTEEPLAEAPSVTEPEEVPEAEEPVREIPFFAPEAKEPTQEFTFEPFHTVDYFASQGIKLSQEEAPKDQLGRQMKSFTEWLKTMKRLPASDLVKSVDSHAEKKVENLAEHSLQRTEIVTEAMAEVWARQGNHHKALEIYNKLSLQNPSKKAYFAAKIENLKKSH